jgi:predicted nicotinamide N-methyase
MQRSRRTKIRAYGLDILLARHPEVRRLKQQHIPACHGNKVWSSSWLLMDFFDRQKMPPQTRVLEVGCGWGLAGIYCAKKYGALVTAVDKDPDVFPFLRLQAGINQVQIQTARKVFGGITPEYLRKFNLLIGSDICFWDKMILPLKILINRALRAGVQMVAVSDPGRPPFEELADYYVAKGAGKRSERTVSRPRRIRGHLLKIGSLGNRVST